jgi:tetratricopeptide (TPR) repeat protein
MKHILQICLFFILANSAFSQFTDEQIQTFLKTGNQQELLEKNTLCILEKNYYHSQLLAQKLVEKEPNNANFNYRLGYSLINSSSDFTKSLPYLEKAVTKISKNYDIFSAKESGAPIDALFHLGQSYHFNNDIEKAIEYYTIFLERVPKKSELVAITELKLKQCEAALILLSKVNANTKIINLGTAINSAEPDYSPVVSLDGYSLYFTSRRLRSDSTNIDIREEGTGMFLEDVYVSYKDDDGNWSPPQIMDFCLPERNEATVAVSIDERRIYIYMDQTGNGDIYYSDFEGSKFQELKILETFGVNTNYWEPHITVTPDGQQKFFSSDRPGGYGGRDIYRIVKQRDGSWSAPENLGPKINTPYDEDAPFLAIDNKTMYFSNNGPNSMGGFDIFMTTKDENDQWSDPVNLGAPINSTSDDIYYTTTVDGKTGYITSFRPGGIGEKDIYEIHNDIYGVTNIAVLRGEIETVGGVPLPEDIAYTVRCLTCKDAIDLTLFPRIHDGSFISPLNPCEEYEIAFHYEQGKTVFHRERFTTQCDMGYEEIYRHLLIDTEKMIVIQPKDEIKAYPPIAMKHYFGYNKNKLNVQEGALKQFLDAVADQYENGRTEFVFIINSSASHVPTRTFKTNENLAATRANQLEALLDEYLNGQTELKSVVSVNVQDIVVAGPEYTQRDHKNIHKYAPYQYVEVLVTGINSMDEADILQSKDKELAAKTDLPGISVTTYIDKNGDEFKTGDHIESMYTYHVIVGVFKRLNNAEGMVNDLRSKGYDAKIIGQRNGLHTVSAGASNSISDIRNVLEKARGEVIPSAWILNTSK